MSTRAGEAVDVLMLSEDLRAAVEKLAAATTDVGELLELAADRTLADEVEAKAKAVLEAEAREQRRAAATDRYLEARRGIDTSIATAFGRRLLLLPERRAEEQEAKRWLAEKGLVGEVKSR
jgi:hypothetical protein